VRQQLQIDDEKKKISGMMAVCVLLWNHHARHREVYVQLLTGRFTGHYSSKQSTPPVPTYGQMDSPPADG
jgi:hypothetical protein